MLTACSPVSPSVGWPPLSERTIWNCTCTIHPRYLGRLLISFFSSFFFYSHVIISSLYNRLFVRGKITEGLMESRKGCCSEFSAGLLEKGKLFRSFLLIPDPTFARLSYRLFEGWPPSSPTCFFWYVKWNGFSLSFVVKRFISCNFAISIYSYIRNGGFRRFEIILINQWYPMMMTLNT